MGGKTQQRIAGNARPAKSGRIRELLVNQQIGSRPPGNIITFSALSNRKQPSPSQPKMDMAEKDTDLKVVEDSRKLDDLKAAKTFEETKNTTSVKENYKLLVRRVGNRDLYTRVRVNGQEEQDGGSWTESAVASSDVGIKKPTYSLDSTNLSKEKSDDPTASSEEEGEEDSYEESGSESGDEVEGDFDDLIERLARVQEESQSIEIDTLAETNEKQIEKEVELLHLLRNVVKKFSHDLSIEDWDLLVRSLYRWINWIAKAEHPFRETFHANFSIKVFKFIHHLIYLAETFKSQENSSVESSMMQSLLDDWANFHSSAMFQEIVVLYFKLIGLENTGAQSTDIVRPMIESLAHIIIGVDPKLVLSHYSLLDNFSSSVALDPDFKAPSNSIFCNVDERKFKGFLSVCGLMKSNYRVILVSAHTMLSKTLDSICTDALQVITPAQQDQDQIVDEEIPILPPVALMSTLTSRDALMSTLLSDYRVGDTSVTIEHNTDAYCCALSYLFAWDLVIQFIVGVDKEIGHKIIHSLKKLGLIQRLLDNIFILLPPLGEQNSLKFRIYKSPPSKIKSFVVNNNQPTEQQPWNLENFLKTPLRTTVKRPLNEIELIALHLYFSVALHMPVTVRKWYNNNSNKRLCNLVNEYTVKHISRVICSLEMESVQEKCLERASQVGSTNLTIKARPSAKEVYAIYNRDEFKMELTIKLPLNYPLGPVQIDGGKRVGVTDVKWRSWLLQLTTFLAHQNGPILDGIELWRKNIDKRFEGVEKCTICFSILHSNYQLPKKRCQTCSNMFHNLCLFKWFESSGNSTCPLCRNPW